MNDNLLILTKIKKTIMRLDKITENFSRNEIALRDSIKKTMYSLLEECYMANINKAEERFFHQKKVLVKIKMLDFYINVSYEKKLLSIKQFESIGKHLLDTFVLTQAWIKSGINNEEKE